MQPSARLSPDISPQWPAIAAEYWQRAGGAERIDVRIGDAAQTLAALAGASRGTGCRRACTAAG